MTHSPQKCKVCGKYHCLAGCVPLTVCLAKVNEHPISPEVLSKVLRPEHRAIGLYLTMEAGLLLLNRLRQSLPVAVLLPTDTIEKILFEADQILEWSKSGVEFVKRGKEMIANCARCKKELSEISYIMPDIEGYYDCGAVQRPPLCEECHGIMWRELNE